MQNISVFNFIKHNLKPFKFYLALHLFVITYGAIDISLWPYLSKLLIDKLATAPRESIFDEAFTPALLLIIFTILPGFIWRISDFAWLKMAPLLKKKITVENMQYLMQHSQNFFQSNFSGALTNRVKELATCTHNLLETALYNFLKVFLSLIIAFITLYSIHKIFALGIVLWAILFIILAIRAAKLTDKMSADIADQSSKITGCLVDILSNISNIKFFASATKEKGNVEKICDEYTTLSRKRNWFLLKFFTIHGITFSVYFVFCITTLLYLYSKNLVTLGDFMMLFTINNWLIHEMWIAAGQMRNYLENLGTIKRAIATIHQPLELKDGERILEINKGEIIFENVDFFYKNSKQLFSNTSIKIKAGEKVGLVGHSGGGKSTFINLILRFYDINSGRILIDGQDISQVTLDSLHQAIGVIPQDPSLFHRTLIENISYGKNEASPEEITAAATNAHADIFIKHLESGYDSLVGERGIKLSGGQRQRIAIARAFLKNAPILILDEATSALDSVTENIIQDSLKNLMQNKTTLVIAHRLSTLKIMDRILVFEKGEIVEDGSHQQLLALNGHYKKLWEAQVGGIPSVDITNAEAFLICGETEEEVDIK